MVTQQDDSILLDYEGVDDDLQRGGRRSSTVRESPSLVRYATKQRYKRRSNRATASLCPRRRLSRS